MEKYAAFSLSALTEGWGVPFPIAPVLAALVSTVIGVLVGLPALRTRGLTLGVVTLALAYAIEAVWFRNTDIVGTGGARVTDPSIFGLDLQIGSGREFPRIEFGLLCLATLVVVALGVALLRRSALGSAMLAVRANERSAAAAGVNVVRVKVLAFAIASFIAGLGGCLLAYRRSSVTFDSFTAMGGLALLSTAYLAGVTSVWGGINAGILASTGITFIALDRWVDLGSWFEVISGVLLIITLISNPEGIAGMGHKLADRWAAMRTRRSGGGASTEEHSLMATVDDDVPEAAAAVVPDGAPVLEVDHLTVRYGGVVAVNDVSLLVRPGAIVGLIGPNGAGKTSVIDAITGFAGASGRVDLAGRTLMPAMIDAHAHLGYEGYTSWRGENYTRENVVDHLNRYAYYGFGAVFSTGTDPDDEAITAILSAIRELMNPPAPKRRGIGFTADLEKTR